MSIFLDSAQIDEIKRALQLSFVEGVTTNPAHIARTGRPGLEVLAEIVDLVDGPVFYQVTADSLAARLDQAWEAHELRPDKVVIKIPGTTENMRLVAQLSEAGVECLVTAVASPAQAYLAAQVNAEYVAPYVNRLSKQLGDGIAIVRDMVRILNGTQTEVLAASLKTMDEVVATLLAGAHHVTLPLDLILTLGDHPFTQQAIAEFNAAMQAAG